jgi:hypothetical protein
MFKRLMKTFFNGQSEVSRGPDESINEHPNFRAVRPNAAAVHYPPQDPGLTCPSAKRMVDSQSEITSKLKLHAAVAPELYSERFATPIQNLAAIVANLPGSASGVFAGEGGMFRASLKWLSTVSGHPMAEYLRVHPLLRNATCSKVAGATSVLPLAALSTRGSTAKHAGSQCESAAMGAGTGCPCRMDP